MNDNSEIRAEGPVNVRQIRQFYMKEQFNDHMRFNLSGMISAKDAEECERKSLLGQIVRFYTEKNEEEQLISSGIITNAEIFTEDGIFYILIEGASASIQLTSVKKNRSFQNPEWTYRDLLKKMGGGQADLLYRYGEEMQLKFPVIQYYETDWDLLLRLAGRLHTVLIPETKSGKNRVFFGAPEGMFHSLEIREHGLSVKAGEEEGWQVCMTVSRAELMELGDIVMYDRRRWMIVERQAKIRQNQLELTYRLGRRLDQDLPFKVNPCLRGAAIRGTVLRRKGGSLKLSLKNDENQSESDAYWYPYLPETGNLMYSMPEEGAQAMLYFPDGSEKNAIVIHSFYNCSQKDGRKNPDKKKLSIPSGKWLSLQPGFIEFAARKRERLNTLDLGERLGIRLLSQHSIRLKAAKGIHICSGLNCTVTGGSLIAVKQSGDKNQIELSGNQIVFKAEKYYTSSVTHRSKNALPRECNEAALQSFDRLHGILTGMLAQGGSDAVNEAILGGIPVLGVTKGKTGIKSQIGLHIRRDPLK